MPPSPSRVAAAFLRSAYAEYRNLSDERKATIMGALVYFLRDRVNSRSTFMVRRPKDVRFKAVDGRVEVKDFPVPDVAWIEYDDERREVRVLNRGGTVLAKAPFHARLDYTTVALKAFGQEMGRVAHSLLIEIKSNQPGRTEQRLEQEQAEEESLRQRVQREKEEAEALSRENARKQQEKLDKERVERERRQEWEATHILGPELVAGLARVGVNGRHVNDLSFTGGLIWLDVGRLSWGTRGTNDGFYWSLSAGTSGWLLPDGLASHGATLPAMPKEKAIPLIAKGVKEALAKIQAGAAKKKQEEEKAESEQVWSVARDGYMIADAEGDDDEGGHSQGYIAEVETFTSKEEALAYARDIAPCYLVKGTQMWNEPVGQTEEDDRPHGRAWYQLIQGDRR